jgi:hypothetical protein
MAGRGGTLPWFAGPPYPDRWPLSFSGARRPASTSSTNWMAIQIFPKTSMRGSSAQPAPDCISSTERLASCWAKQRSKAASAGGHFRRGARNRAQPGIEKTRRVESAGLRHRLSRLACPAIRCRLRFLTDRRRRFMLPRALRPLVPPASGSPLRLLSSVDQATTGRTSP